MIRYPFAGLAGVLLLAVVGAEARAADVSISERDMAFVPDHVTIKQGDRIIFRNDSDLSHQVIVAKGAAPDMALAKQHRGETATLTISARGTLEIGCDFHPMMTLTVTVE